MSWNLTTSNTINDDDTKKKHMQSSMTLTAMVIRTAPSPGSRYWAVVPYTSVGSFSMWKNR